MESQGLLASSSCEIKLVQTDCMNAQLLVSDAGKVKEQST